MAKSRSPQAVKQFISTLPTTVPAVPPLRCFVSSGKTSLVLHNRLQQCHPPLISFVWRFLVIAIYHTSRLQIFAEPQQSSRLSPEEERQSMYCLISRLLQVPLTALANNNNNYNHSVSFLYLPPPTIRSFICSANIVGLPGRRRRIREWLNHHSSLLQLLFIRPRARNEFRSYHSEYIRQQEVGTHRTESYICGCARG